MTAFDFQEVVFLNAIEIHRYNWFYDLLLPYSVFNLKEIILEFYQEENIIYGIVHA
jgi:hypothetical protein